MKQKQLYIVIILQKDINNSSLINILFLSVSEAKLYNLSPDFFSNDVSYEKFDIQEYSHDIYPILDTYIITPGFCNTKDSNLETYGLMQNSKLHSIDIIIPYYNWLEYPFESSFIKSLPSLLKQTLSVEYDSAIWDDILRFFPPQNNKPNTLQFIKNNNFICEIVLIDLWDPICEHYHDSIVFMLRYINSQEELIMSLIKDISKKHKNIYIQAST